MRRGRARVQGTDRVLLPASGRGSSRQAPSRRRDRPAAERRTTGSSSSCSGQCRRSDQAGDGSSATATGSSCRERRRRPPGTRSSRSAEPELSGRVGYHALPHGLRDRRSRRRRDRYGPRLGQPRHDRACSGPRVHVRLRVDVVTALSRRAHPGRDRADRARCGHGVDHDHGGDRQRVRTARPRRDGGRSRRPSPVGRNRRRVRDRLSVRVPRQPVHDREGQGSRGGAPVPPPLGRGSASDRS